MGNYVSKNTSAEAKNGRKSINHELICQNIKEKIKYKNMMALVYALAFFIVSALNAFIVLIAEPFKDFRADILIFALLTLPVIIGLIVVAFNLRTQQKICNKEYTLVLDNVVNVKEDIKLYREMNLHNIRYVMYLSSFGKVRLKNASDMSINQINDTVYVVVLKNRPKKALLWYNSKYYEPVI